MKYKVGEKIYNRGDMANQPGWFKITRFDKKWKTYDLKEIKGNRKINALCESGISEIDKGNSMTRFVTKKAYNEFKKQQFKQIQKYLKKH